MDSNRPRLLVLTSTYPRWEGDTEPRFVEALSYELAGAFDVMVLVPHCKGALPEETFTSNGRSIEVRRFRYCPDALETLAYDGGMLFRLRRNPLRVLLLPFFLLAQGVAAFRLHRERGFDAVHAHWIMPQGFVVAILSVLTRRFPPALVTSHGGDLYGLRGPVFERLQRWILGSADGVTVVSHAMQDYCEEHRLAPGKTIVQSMGVDLEGMFTPGETAHRRDGLVFVGRLVEKKGVEYLIEAMAILAPDYPQLKLTIVGDGPLRESLTALADSRGLGDRVRFLGSVRNEQVPGYLRTAVIFVMPSVVAASGDQEGLGLVAVEAQGCGCAVVASDLAAVRDTVIDGQTGLMAKPADAADLAGKIALLLDDDILCKSLAESGRRHALLEFNWSAVGSRYSEIISGLIEDSYL
ncbi:MAG: glycosyltransferase [Gammaproteobacteria bacterium]|nr:glycosyltransferase [Gammaproteobacteria bacterium]